MKRITSLFLLLIIGAGLQAQNWNEWFRQKKTQIRYLTKQIVALQVYIELGQKGYGIYKDGLGLISDIKDGDFNLHKDYFASLSAVNPRVRGSVNVHEIILWDEQVGILRRRIVQMELGNSQPSLNRLFDQLSKRSSDNREQLELLITNGNYQLKDEERVEQINAIHASEYELYSFAKSTYQDAVAYVRQQGKDAQEIKVIKQLQGLP